MSKDWQSQAHVKWECKFHVVIVPKYRKKLLYGKLRRKVGEILRDLCRQAEVGLVEGLSSHCARGTTTAPPAPALARAL